MKTARLQEVEVEAIDAVRLEPLIGADRMAQFERAAEAARESLSGGSVWNVNSTPSGGGVAEMLQTLLSYARCCEEGGEAALFRGAGPVRGGRRYLKAPPPPCPASRA